MLLVDANVLLHAVNERSAEHAVARDWLRDALRVVNLSPLPGPSLSRFCG